MTEPISMNQALIRKLTDITIANISNGHFGVEELAKEAGISRITLYRKIKSIKNQDASQFIRELRLRHSMELLQKNAATVSEVAFMVGFTDPAYFNKCFHDFFGFPPGKFKKEASNLDKDKASDEANETSKPARPRWLAYLIPSSVFLAFAVLLLLGYIISFRNPHEDEGNLEVIPEKSIAVLPFINDSPNDSNQYFINGLMEQILNDLQTIKDLTVIRRYSIEQYRNTTKTVPEIAKELGVNYIVAGSGQKSGNIIHLNVELLNGFSEERIWGKPYEQEINGPDIFRIQSQIAETIAQELKAVIKPQEKLLMEKTPTSNLDAYEDYLQGITYLRKFTKQDMDIALLYFEQAIKKDPDFALAYTGIFTVWIDRALYSSATPEVATLKAKAAFTKAFALDSTLAEVYICLENIQSYITYDWKGAESSIKKAIALNPNNTESHYVYAFLLIIEGRFEEAIGQNELAIKLDPLNPSAKAGYGLTLLFAHKYNEAIKVFQQVLIRDPENLMAIGNLPEAFHQTGRYMEALEAWKSYSRSSIFQGFVHSFDQGYAKKGYVGALNSEADTLASQSKTININPFEIALIYACAGNKEGTMMLLERDYEGHDLNLPFSLSYPVFDNLRSEPRFQNLCSKMNLPYKSEY
jgi:TolB-like protein/AraC-like DNA-binding protein/Tfp pilus assembly protein PilF